MSNASAVSTPLVLSARAADALPSGLRCRTDAHMPCALLTRDGKPRSIPSPTRCCDPDLFCFCGFGFWKSREKPCGVSLLSFLLHLCCCGLCSQAPSSATLPRVGPASCKGNVTAGSHLLNSSTCWLLCTDTQQPLRDWSQMVSCHPVSRPSPGMVKLPPPSLLMCFSTDKVCWLPFGPVSGLRQPTEKKGLPQTQTLQGKLPGQHFCFATPCQSYFESFSSSLIGRGMGGGGSPHEGNSETAFQTYQSD